MRRFTFKVVERDGTPVTKYVAAEGMNEAIERVQSEGFSIVDVHESTVKWNTYRKWLHEEMELSELMKYVIEPALQELYFDGDLLLRDEDVPTNIADLIRGGMEHTGYDPITHQHEQDTELREL